MRKHTPQTEQKRSSIVQGKRQISLYILPETYRLLQAIQDRDGVPMSGQVDRAVKLWAEQKGIEVSQ